ncbi:MAG TPA: alpha/beta hydrolase [Vicinamibacterales bacterium]
MSKTEAIFADVPTEGPGELGVGWCDVSVPRFAHRIGAIERPTFFTLRVTDWFENADRHFVILDRPIVEPQTFWSTVASVVGRTQERQLLLFVHGYNVSFDDAVYRTAQLAFDLNFQGAPVLYSWPSNAATLRYVADSDHSLSTLASFERFLIELSRQSGARTIHVIAHSMGNNALVHALAELAATPPPRPHFREIIMAAPDVDRREFLRLADAFQSSADHVTLYAASNDRAIGASDTLHGDPRVGDANPMFLRKGIDSIDASDIIKGFLKHSYFADSRVLDDIQRLIEHDAPLPRFGLVGMPTNDGATYWRFRQAR